MSVVGPRPERQIIADQYTEEISGIRTPAESKSGTDRVCTGIWKV